jgi:DUF971 family protein
MKPISIRRIDTNFIVMEWSDGFRASIKQEVLRKECPCADCRQDALNNKHNNFIMLNTFSSGKNTLKELKPTGNYGLKAVWGDGHDTGIYPWELLREIFERNNINKFSEQ